WSSDVCSSDLLERGGSSPDPDKGTAATKDEARGSWIEVLGAGRRRSRLEAWRGSIVPSRWIVKTAPTVPIGSIAPRKSTGSIGPSALNAPTGSSVQIVWTESNVPRGSSAPTGPRRSSASKKSSASSGASASTGPSGAAGTNPSYAPALTGLASVHHHRHVAVGMLVVEHQLVTQRNLVEVVRLRETRVDLPVGDQLRHRGSLLVVGAVAALEAFLPHPVTAEL